MGRDRAAYMREYRKLKRTQTTTLTGDLDDPFGQELMRLRIVQLEEEVRHLKAELAKRPGGIAQRPLVVADSQAGARFNTQPFSGPIPKRRG